MSLVQNEVPLMWKKKRKRHRFLTGDAGDPDNYRPISVLPILSKILEKTVHSQLIEYLISSAIVKGIVSLEIRSL